MAGVVRPYAREGSSNVELETHQLLPVAVGGIPPAEGDLAVGEGNQPLVGDRDAVGVTAEVAQRLLGTAEGRLQVDDFLRNSVRKKAEKARSWERNRRLTVKAESSGREGLPQSLDKLAAKRCKRGCPWERKKSS